jgi:hypothetical protein
MRFLPFLSNTLFYVYFVSLCVSQSIYMIVSLPDNSGKFTYFFGILEKEKISIFY